MRCSALKSRGRPGDDEEMGYCCSGLNVRVYGPPSGMLAGLAVLGEEESGHDLEQGNLLGPGAVLEEQGGDLVQAAEAVRASGR